MGNKRKTNTNRTKQIKDSKRQYVDRKEENTLYISEIEKPVRIVVQAERNVSLADKINIFMAFLTLLSVVGVIFTLHEMRVQRNASYNPSIVFNPVEVTFEWDKDGNESWITIDNQKVESSTQINEDGSISGTIQIPIVSLMDSFTEYSVVNVGVGTAKNIVFHWNENNTQKLYEYLLLCSPEKSDFCVIGEMSDNFSINNTLVMTNKESKVQLMYMLPEAEETYSLLFPPQYTLLINEAIKSGGMKGDNNPYLTLKVSYQDIQGNTKSDLIIVLIKRTLLEEKPDGSGKATYQLIQAFPSDVVE